ncbi:uncharacterized protein LOC110625086 [Manihot esculenta]|uniref:Tify domain-containing protein n=1 Tax=Manihot esculenta TaxID=3983 RepID=A0A2C9V322_MANES|nr:uncharacterized protein LOC110625086 [Manihot esculenta]OAY38678.1 hypothetical protein MANES_10G034700v8 [Manihot esculenta]
MSFQQKSFWMSRDAGCLTDGEMGYDSSSRIQPKRGHQWFMDTTDPESFNKKKQAIEAVGKVLATSHMNISPWHNASSFQSVSGQFSDRPFGSEAVQTSNMVDQNFPSSGGGNMNINMGRKEFNDQYVCNSSMGLSMSHTIEDPLGCISFGGLRKVKINRVGDSSNAISASVAHSYSQGDSNAISIGTTYSKNGSNAISLGPTDNNTISIGPSFSKADSNFITMGHTFNKGDGDFISMGHNYDKGDDSILSMGQPFDKGDASFITMGLSYEKDDSNVISMVHSFSKGHENFITMGPTYDKANENFISMGPSYGKGNESIISIGASYDKPDSNMTSICSVQDKGDFNILSMGHNYNKGESNTISFGGFHDEPEANASGTTIGGYDVLMGNQNSAQTSGAAGAKDFVQSNLDPTVNNAPKANTTAPKNKDAKTSKKAPPNNFPSNVKSLLSTGMLDGVPVKYVSWSREKSLKGIIKGTGYLCGCQQCNFSKTLNAYEFERHANCKTKHPNNHIYFENGKTIYAVVQELKNTPQEMLFDVIQNVTGSSINQKNFRSWKASYQAATRELQRIYGKDEVVMPS